MYNQQQSPLIVSIVDAGHAFKDLRIEWNELVTQCTGSMFFRHEWFDAAWAWRKTESTLFALLARRDGRLVGILPLIGTLQKQHLLRVRCLELLTVPDTQSCDLIVAPEHSDEVIEAFCNELNQRRHLWDRINLRYLNGNQTAAHKMMAGLLHRHFHCVDRPQGPNLFVPLHGTWEAYYATRTRSLKKANNLAANRLKKLGKIDIDWITADNPDAAAIESALAQSIDISQRSWKKDTGNSLDQPGPKEFITVLTRHAKENGWLSLWLLTLDGKALAMEYQLRDANNVYALRADFDAECEEVSPGSYLMRNLLETLFGRGLQRYYMGPGENAYKTRWTAEADALHEIVIYGKTLGGRLARAVNEVLRPAARALRDRFQSSESSTK